jgi:hypothetical protein
VGPATIRHNILQKLQGLSETRSGENTAQLFMLYPWQALPRITALWHLVKPRMGKELAKVIGNGRGRAGFEPRPLSLNVSLWCYLLSNKGVPVFSESVS